LEATALQIKDETTQGAPKRKGRGDFFAIDRRTWTALCSLATREKNINLPVVYLVLARFSQADNRDTAASVRAIEKYTGISRQRAKAALALLLDEGGFLEQTAFGTRPRYELLPAHEIPATGIQKDSRPPPTAKERAVLGRILQGILPENRIERAAATRLIAKRWLNKDLSPREERTTTDWIWLPNALVSGAAREIPPVELLRQGHDPMALRLFVDFYHAQNLGEDGGIGRGTYYKEFKRARVGERGEYVVWGFVASGSNWVTWNDVTTPHRRPEAQLTEEELEAGDNRGVDFFRRARLLCRLGLVEWIPHLFESKDPEAEPIHPYGIGRSESLEDRLGIAAHEAASKMVTEGQLEWASRSLTGEPWLAPVLSHIENVELIGIARLRYRPRTRAVSAWWSKHTATCERYLRSYRELARRWE
jgi:hypothetical protein